jgi:hypothetical protein
MLRHGRRNMHRRQSTRLAALLMVAVLSCLGYTAMYAWAFADPEYDLTVDNIPVNFDGNKTLYLDTQTNDRGFVIYNDHLKIRSQYLTFWDFNESYDHEDVCLVNGSYAYATVPAMNLTLDSITEINRFQLSSWNGTVTVGCTEYSASRMTLQVNSTDNATLLIRAVELHRNYEYRVFVDDQPREWLKVNDAQYIEYNYTGDWSNHTITLLQYGQYITVPSASLYMIQLFLILGVVFVVIKLLVWPLRNQKPVNLDLLMRRFFYAGMYIVISSFAIILTFKLFVGV